MLIAAMKAKNHRLQLSHEYLSDSFVEEDSCEEDSEDIVHQNKIKAEKEEYD